MLLKDPVNELKTNKSPINNQNDFIHDYNKMHSDTCYIAPTK